MPRKAEELSARAVSSIKEEGRHPVGGAEGLYLQVAGGSRTWILRVAIGTRINKAGKAVAHRPEIGLGSYPAVTLAEAREKARAYRKQARDGVDLLAARKEAKALALAEAEKNKTFEQAAPMYIAAQKEGWKNAKHIQQWENTLATYAYPIIGSALVADIDTDMVLKVLLQEVDVKGKKPVTQLTLHELGMPRQKRLAAFEGELRPFLIGPSFANFAKAIILPAGRAT